MNKGVNFYESLKEALEHQPRSAKYWLIENIKSISKAARDWYSQVQNDNTRKISVALIVSSFYTRIIANLFLRFKDSRTEMKIFNEKDIAVNWVYQQLEINASQVG